MSATTPLNRVRIAAVVALAVWAASAGGQTTADEPWRTDVFVSGQEGYLAYRIPALIATPRGALLAFCEARKSSFEDDGDIDLLSRRSEDQGRTWLKPELVIEEGDDAPIKFGNPTPVVDHETGAVWLAVNRDHLDDNGARQGGRLLLLRSEDDGRSWARPLDITEQIKQPGWGYYAFGPGIGIQIRRGPHRGRLILPANYRESFDKRQPSWSHVIYSDDHGQTWQLGGRLGEHTNECQVVEVVEEGQPALLFNARNHRGRVGLKEQAGKRLVARSRDGGLTWSAEQMDLALPDPPCQASLLRYSFPTDGGPSRILFANPAGPGRSHLTLRLSLDEGHTWPVSKLLYEGSAAYSCLARLPTGQVGVVFERDNYGKLTFAAFDLEWLSSPEKATEP